MKLSIITLVILLIYIVIDRIEKADINETLDSIINYCNKVNDWIWNFNHSFREIICRIANIFGDYAESLIRFGNRAEDINEEDKEETK